MNFQVFLQRAIFSSSDENT